MNVRSVQSFSVAGDMVMIFSSGICSTVAACMVFDQHRSNVGRKVDSEAVVAAKADAVSAFAHQVAEIEVRHQW